MRLLSPAHTRGNSWAKSLARPLAQLFPPMCAYILVRFLPREVVRQISIVFDNLFLTKIYAHTGENSWANGFTRHLLSCFLSCAPGFRHMDRSEIKLLNSDKNIVISHIQSETLKQKKFTGSGFEGAPRLLKVFFIETIFMSKLWDTQDSNSGKFFSTDLKFGSFIAK